MEKRKVEKKMENNGENSGPLTSLPVDRLTATDCNAAARANINMAEGGCDQSQNIISEIEWTLFEIVAIFLPVAILGFFVMKCCCSQGLYFKRGEIANGDEKKPETVQKAGKEC